MKIESRLAKLKTYADLHQMPARDANGQFYIRHYGADIEPQLITVPMTRIQLYGLEKLVDAIPDLVAALDEAVKALRFTVKRDALLGEGLTQSQYALNFIEKRICK